MVNRIDELQWREETLLKEERLTFHNRGKERRNISNASHLATRMINLGTRAFALPIFASSMMFRLRGRMVFLPTPTCSHRVHD